MYKAIVFDLDGTLLDTLDDLKNSVNFALQQEGFPVRTREEIRTFVGNGMLKLIERALGQERYPQFDRVLKTFKAHYAEHCADCTKPYEGVLALLETLQARGIKTGILSNKADAATKALAKLYFGERIEYAAGENEAAGIKKKPAPDALFAMMQEMGVERGETLYVGDSDVDVNTAKNAGVDCVAVTWGFRSEEVLREAGATRFADTPMQILTYIKEG